MRVKTDAIMWKKHFFSLILQMKMWRKACHKKQIEEPTIHLTLSNLPNDEKNTLNNSLDDA